MRELSEKEMMRVEGGFFFAPFLVGSLVGLGSYVFGKVKHKDLMSYEGAATAAGFGAVTGGVGGVVIGAAGGGIVGNLVWRPGFMAINTAGQLIATEK